MNPRGSDYIHPFFPLKFYIVFTASPVGLSGSEGPSWIVIDFQSTVLRLEVRGPSWDIICLNFKSTLLSIILINAIRSLQAIFSWYSSSSMEHLNLRCLGWYLVQLGGFVSPQLFTLWIADHPLFYLWVMCLQRVKRVNHSIR